MHGCMTTREESVVGVEEDSEGMEGTSHVEVRGCHVSVW